MSTLRRVDNQASLVMNPAEGELWTTPGPMAEDQADRYYRLDVGKLFSNRKLIQTSETQGQE
jgi:hypothetical protein